MEHVEVEDEVVWGAEAMGKVIGRSTRATFNMLEKGELPAKKIGGRWASGRRKLIAHILKDSE